MTIVDVNPWAILICGVIAMIVGSLWYGPIFGKLWIKEMGFTKEDIEKGKSQNMAVTYLISFIGSLVMAYILKHFLTYAGALTVTQALAGAFWAWLGFVVTVLINSVLFDGRKLSVFFINISHYLVTMLAMGAVLVSM